MNRLEELRKNAPKFDESERDLEANTSGLNSEKHTDQESMKLFLSDVEIVKKNLSVIQRGADKILELNQNMQQATTAEREGDLHLQLEPIVKSTNKKALVTKNYLKRFTEDIARLKTPGGSATDGHHRHSTATELRIRENLTSTLTRKFVDLMKRYQEVQVKFKSDLKNKVKRQIQVVKPNATAEEIDAVFKSGGGSGDVLKNTILKGDAADAIQSAYRNTADKYQDVLVLEASVAELNQMFTDFALLVEQQGGLLDKIEVQVAAADEYIGEGNTEMHKAIQLLWEIRKKQCCIAMIVLTVLFIIGLFIGLKVAGSL